MAGLVSHRRNTSSSGFIRSVAGTPTVVACCTGGTLIVFPGAAARTITAASRFPGSAGLRIRPTTSRGRRRSVIAGASAPGTATSHIENRPRHGPQGPEDLAGDTYSTTGPWPSTTWRPRRRAWPTMCAQPRALPLPSASPTRGLRGAVVDPASASGLSFGMMSLIWSSDAAYAIVPIVLRKRASATLKRTAPIRARARNCSQTALRSAPR